MLSAITFIIISTIWVIGFCYLMTCGPSWLFSMYVCVSLCVVLGVYTNISNQTEGLIWGSLAGLIMFSFIEVYQWWEDINTNYKAMVDKQPSQGE